MASKPVRIDFTAGMNSTTVRNLLTPTTTFTYQQGSASRATFAIENTAALTTTTWTITFEYKTPNASILTIATATLINSAANTLTTAILNTSLFGSPAIQVVPFPNQITYTLTSGSSVLTSIAWGFYSN